MENELFGRLSSYENLQLAFQKARKRKTKKDYVLEFEKDLKDNLIQLQSELVLQTYSPKPLKTFIVMDPKTRKISKSDFRDRVVHHALCNVIEPIFEKSFIFDAYANRKGKGALKAIQRFDDFKRRVSKNFTRKCFVLKADIKHYFDTVNHRVLMGILSIKIHDDKILRLIKIILANFSENVGGGMECRLGI